MLKKYPVLIAIFLLIILFIILCFCNQWQNTIWTNLLDGLPTETIGILITLIFVQLLFDRYNANLQKEEEKKKILRFHKIVNMDIEKYELFLSNMISNSQQEQDHYDIQSSFNIKKLKYAHNVCLLLNQSFQKTNIEVFYKLK